MRSRFLIVAFTLVGSWSSADAALALEQEGEGASPQRAESESGGQEERFIQMEHYSFTVPDEGGWTIQKPGGPFEPVVLKMKLGPAGDPTRIQIQVFKNVITKKRLVKKSGKENADNIFGLEQKIMHEQGVKMGLYKLHGPSKGEEEVAGKHFFFMDYETETATDVQPSSLYLLFPLERDNTWFLMVHYTQIVPKTTGLREQAKTSLLEILRTLEIKRDLP